MVALALFLTSFLGQSSLLLISTLLKTRGQKVRKVVPSMDVLTCYSCTSIAQVPTMLGKVLSTDIGAPCLSLQTVQ